MNKTLVAVKMDVLALRMCSGKEVYIKGKEETYQKILAEKGKMSKYDRQLLYMVVEGLDGENTIICLSKIEDVRLDKEAYVFCQDADTEEPFNDDDSLRPGFLWEGDNLYKVG